MKFVAALACGLALFAAPQKNEDPERWLQTAIQAETVDGDLKNSGHFCRHIKKGN